MDDEQIRHHIEGTRQARRLAARILAACWPGGSADRSERAALAWVRRWRPERAGVTLPACSCATGRCGVCN
jgi:hypothetical protein